MPRRIYTYDRDGWEPYNLISTIGSFVMGVAILVFFVNTIWTGAAPAPSRQRPLARRHAGVVHDVAASSAQFDKVPYVTSARPCETSAAGSGRQAEMRPGALASADRARGRGRDACSGGLGVGRDFLTCAGHRVLAALALPPLAAVAAAAWI